MGADFGEEFEAVEGLDEEVCEDEVYFGASDDFECFLRAITAENAKVWSLQVFGGPIEEIDVGIDEEQGVGEFSFSHRGSRRVSRFSADANSRFAYFSLLLAVVGIGSVLSEVVLV